MMTAWSGSGRVAAMIKKVLAERWDQKTYGLQKQAQVTINMQDLRIDALRHVEVISDLSTGEEA